MSANYTNFANNQRPKNIVELIDKDEVYEVVGAAMEVHKHLGCGFLEPVYQEAFEIELRDRKVPFKTQYEIPIQYKNKTLKKRYIADLIVFDKVIVEIKAESHLTTTDEAQLLNYLKAAGVKVGVLINFGQRAWNGKELSKRVDHVFLKISGISVIRG